MKKMVVFEMDNTVLHGRFIDTCARKYNFRQALDLLRNIDKNSISLTKRICSFLKGKPVQELIRIADEMPMTRDLHEVIGELKARGYIIGLITDSYHVIAEHICKKMGGDFSLAYELKHIDGYATGEVIIPRSFYFSEESSCNHPVCKTNALRAICREKDVDMENSIVICNNDNDCILHHAGIGVACSWRSFTEVLEYAP